jgi:signal transduction histidine kinase
VPALASANEAGIRRLLLILIDNALKHTSGGGTVTVSSTARDGAVVLSVQDTGEGIAADALAHIFERFCRAGARFSLTLRS